MATEAGAKLEEFREDEEQEGVHVAPLAEEEEEEEEEQVAEDVEDVEDVWREEELPSSGWENTELVYDQSEELATRLRAGQEVDVEVVEEEEEEQEAEYVEDVLGEEVLPSSGWENTELVHDQSEELATRLRAEQEDDVEVVEDKERNEEEEEYHGRSRGGTVLDHETQTMDAASASYPLQIIHVEHPTYGFLALAHYGFAVDGKTAIKMTADEQHFFVCQNAGYYESDHLGAIIDSVNRATWQDKCLVYFVESQSRGEEIRYFNDDAFWVWPDTDSPYFVDHRGWYYMKRGDIWLMVLVDPVTQAYTWNEAMTYVEQQDVERHQVETRRQKADAFVTADNHFTVFLSGTNAKWWHQNNDPARYWQGELVAKLAGNCISPWLFVEGPGTDRIWHHWDGVSRKQGQLEKAFMDEVRGKVAGKGLTANSDFAYGIIKQEYERRRAEGGQLLYVNIVGWSRGSVTGFMVANKLYASGPPLSELLLNMFCVDPVLGSNRTKAIKGTLHENVINLNLYYALNENSAGYGALVPAIDNRTATKIITVPGKHATAVGNAHVDGIKGTKFAPVAGVTDLKEVGILVRDDALEFLQRFGAKFWRIPEFERLSVERRQFFLEQMLSNQKKGCYKAMNTAYYTPLPSFILDGQRGGERLAMFGANRNYSLRRPKKGRLVKNLRTLAAINDNITLIENLGKPEVEEGREEEDESDDGDYDGELLEFSFLEDGDFPVDPLPDQDIIVSLFSEGVEVQESHGSQAEAELLPAVDHVGESFVFPAVIEDYFPEAELHSATEIVEASEEDWSEPETRTRS